RLPPSLKLRRTAVALAEAGQADLPVRLKPDTTGQTQGALVVCSRASRRPRSAPTLRGAARTPVACRDLVCADRGPGESTRSPVVLTIAPKNSWVLVMRPRPPA